MSSRVLTVRALGQWYALDIGGVREVLYGRELISVPLAPEFVAGILAVRGDILTAIDLRSCLGEMPFVDTTCDAVVLDTRPTALAVVIDEIGDVYDVELATLLPVPETTPDQVHRLAVGTFLLDDEPVLLLGPSALVSAVLTSSKELIA